MARGDLLCLIDSLPLGLAVLIQKGNTLRDGVVGGHLHLVIDQVATCSGGHRWHITGDLLMEREA
jgi:hypothetical protein